MFKLFKPTAKPSPAKVERPQRLQGRVAVNWEAARSPLSESDRVVSKLGQAWLQSLPQQVVPQALAAQFPRIVNRFALVWPDPVLTENYFDSLMIDRRGGRKGFPPEVMTELIQLRNHHGRGERLGAARPANAALAMKPIDFDLD